MGSSRPIGPLQSLGQCWILFRRAPLGFLIGGWIVGFLDGGLGSGISLLIEGPTLTSTQWSAPWSGLALALAIWCGMFLVGSWVETGLARTLAAAQDAGSARLSVLFRGGDRFAAMLGARLLAGIILLVCALPFAAACTLAWIRSPLAGGWLALWCALTLVWLALSLYVGLGLLFVRQAVALESAGPRRAIARSWELARGNRRRLLAIECTRTLIDLAGLACLCVGQIASVPLAEAIRTGIFLELTRGGQQAPQADQSA